MKIPVLTKKNSIFSPKFQKNFKKLDPQIQDFIKNELRKIFEHKKIPAIKFLKNYKLARFRLKIGHYRLLFNVFEEKIIFIMIKHRQDLY